MRKTGDLTTSGRLPFVSDYALSTPPLFFLSCTGADWAIITLLFASPCVVLIAIPSCVCPHHTTEISKTPGKTRLNQKLLGRHDRVVLHERRTSIAVILQERNAREKSRRTANGLNMSSPEARKRKKEADGNRETRRYNDEAEIPRQRVGLRQNKENLQQKKRKERERKERERKERAAPRLLTAREFMASWISRGVLWKKA